MLHIAFRIAAALRGLPVLGLCMFGSASTALCYQEPEGLFEKFHSRMKTERSALSQFVCTQTVERFSRNSVEHPWKPVDTMQLDVGVVGDQELYGKAGSGEFYRRPLSEAVGNGVVSTGKFALLARQVLDTTAAKYRYKGVGERDGARAHEYDFDIAQGVSNYRLRAGTLELPVAYQGTFWVKEDTLDLLRLELQAYDIPAKLGLAEAVTSFSYARVAAGDSALLLPVSGSVTLTTVHGVESMNRMRIESCRRYSTQSEVRFAGATMAPESAAGQPFALPEGTLLEAALTEDLPLDKVSAGAALRMKLVKELRDGDSILLPVGTMLFGRIAHMESTDAPFPVVELGLEVSAFEREGRRFPVRLTMTEAGPASGLLREQRRMDPVFDKRRTARMEILVRKVEAGHGFIHWDARKGNIPRGMKIKWRVEQENRRAIREAIAFR
ncbi:MAG: hypothetical protein JNK48_20885 [Bryobacterales bacterium]|nr:hypothetical protein [Bryobacterales bacterium]